jgi:hypothetical protein
MLFALQRFADSIHAKFASHVKGEPEDQLRAPFEQLLADAGTVDNIEVLAVGETLLDNHGGKPDFGVSAGKQSWLGYLLTRVASRTVRPARRRARRRHACRRQPATGTRAVAQGAGSQCVAPADRLTRRS